MASTPEEQMKQSLDTMEKGSTLKFEKGLRDKIGSKKTLKKFQDYKDEWETHKDTVLRSARQIGSFAEAFARFEAEINNKPVGEVKKKHAWAAIAVVRDLCPAGSRPGIRFKWCPEPEPEP
jgi:hypothetical protein